MINGNLEQFLDTGWFSEATLFYDGFIYWFEAQTEGDEITFFVDKWEAQNEDNKYYHSVMNQDDTLTWERVLELKGTDIELIKKDFFKSKIFDGKSFWDVEGKLAWLDEGSALKR